MSCAWDAGSQGDQGLASFEDSRENPKDAKNPCQENLASFGNLGDLRDESVTVGDGVSEAASDGWKDEL